MLSQLTLFSFFFLMIRRPPRSTLFPTRRSSDLEHEVESEVCQIECIKQPASLQRRHKTQLLHSKIGRAHVELQSHSDLVCRLLLEKKIRFHLRQLTLPRVPRWHVPYRIGCNSPV